MGLAVLALMQPPTSVVGQLIASRYRVEAVIGKGGQASVFAATDIQIGRQVALKLLGSQEHMDRFRREAALARGLSHPHTVRLHDFGQDEVGRAYIAYELLNGRGLDVALQGGPMSEARVAAVASGVLKSLMEAHAAGVVHRDIKPANIFLCDFHGESDFVKVLDFGIAKAAATPAITQIGTAIGTPSYMPPEQVAGEETSAATDLYALGMTMGEMLSGQRLVQGGSADEIARMQLDGTAVQLPGAVLQSVLGPIVHRAVRKDPAQRFASAGEMLAAIQATSLDRRSEAGPAPAHALNAAPTGVAINQPSLVTAPAAARKPASSNRAVMFILFGAVVAIGLAIGGMAVFGVFTDAGSKKKSEKVAAKKKSKKKKKGKGKKKAAAPAPAERIHVYWSTTNVVVTRVDDDDIDDVIGFCSGGGTFPCAISGATFNPIWRTHGEPGMGDHPEGIALTRQGVAVIGLDGVVKLLDAKTGKRKATVQAFMKPYEVCAPPEHPDAVWLYSPFGERKNVLVDLAKKTAEIVDRPRSCPQAHGLYRTDDCAGNARDATRTCRHIPLPGRISGMNANWVGFNDKHGVVLGHNASGTPYDKIAAYEVLPDFKGRVLWSRAFNDGDPAQPLSKNIQGFARVRERSISIGGGRVVAVSAASVAAFDLQTGKTLWRNPRTKEDGVIARPDRVYALFGNGVTVLDAKNGKELGRIGQ